MSEGYILHAEAYPHDDQTITITLMYYESEEKVEGRQLSNRQFVVAKDVAQSLTKQLIDIFAAPDTATAWDHLFRKLPEANEGPGIG
jgi:hypothetical protein